MQLSVLGKDPDAPFPPVELALQEPDGLLAVGGDLSVVRLRRAYSHGIFPWYSLGEPILWWSPAIRAGFDPQCMHLPRRLSRWLRKCSWRISTNTCFDAVVAACAAPRSDGHGTWITPAMRAAYLALHVAGDAHSVEVFDGDRLVGGLYGVAAGGVFCAESMFSATSNGSKVALLSMARLWSDGGGVWIDAQIPSPHLATLGARSIARADYLALLRKHAAEMRPFSDIRNLTIERACRLDDWT